MIIGGGELVKSSPILDEEIILVGVEPPIPNVPMVRVAWPEDSGEIILDAAELDTSAELTKRFAKLSNKNY